MFFLYLTVTLNGWHTAGTSYISRYPSLEWPYSSTVSIQKAHGGEHTLITIIALVPAHPYPAQMSQAIDALQTLINSGFRMEDVSRRSTPHKLSRAEHDRSDHHRRRLSWRTSHTLLTVSPEPPTRPMQSRRRGGASDTQDYEI